MSTSPWKYEVIAWDNTQKTSIREYRPAPDKSVANRAARSLRKLYPGLLVTIERKP